MANMEDMTEEELLANFKRNGDARFYQRPLPAVNELVMVKVMRVADTAAYVQLLEYSGIEGMILFSEVSMRRIRSMLKEIRAGQFAVCVVLRVEADKGNIDLSRRRVQAKDRAAYLQTYAKSKLVHSTLRQLSAAHKMPMDDLCNKVSWPLYAKYGHAIDAFKQFINSRDQAIFDCCDVDAKIKKDLYAIIEKKLTPQACKLKAKVEVSCFERAGIDGVKAALLAGLDQDPNEIAKPEERAETAKQEEKGKKGGKEPELKEMGRIQIKVVAPPHYDVTTQSIGKESGIAVIDKALARIETKIKEHGGTFTIRSKPEVVNQEDEEIIEKDLASDDEDDDDSDDEEDETMGKFDAEAAFGKK